ncbi:2043_t:CDS:1, partial [Gigaspora margarita]
SVAIDSDSSPLSSSDSNSSPLSSSDLDSSGGNISSLKYIVQLTNF